MQYYPQAPIDTVLNKVKDILEYGELARYPYTLLTTTSFVCQVHPGNLSIPIEDTRHTQEELKCQYNKNLQVFQKKRGVERALIQQHILSVEAKYITAMSNSTTGQFIGTLFMLIQYLIVTYRKYLQANWLT